MKISREKKEYSNIQIILLIPISSWVFKMGQHRNWSYLDKTKLRGERRHEHPYLDVICPWGMGRNYNHIYIRMGRSTRRNTINIIQTLKTRF